MENQGNVKRPPDPQGLTPVTDPYKDASAKANMAKRNGQRRAAKDLAKPPSGY